MTEPGSEPKAIDTGGIDPEQQAGLQSLLEDFTPPDRLGSEPEQSDLSSGELCGVVASVLFGFMASRRGDHWALSPDESEQLGNATGAVLDKYAPDMNAGPEYALLGVAAVLVVPRIMADKAIADKRGADGGDQSEAGSTE